MSGRNFGIHTAVLSTKKTRSLEEVDKFTYLRSLLTGQANSAIAGFALTSANYGAAVELLTK